jgi:hypothetical protein
MGCAFDKCRKLLADADPVIPLFYETPRLFSQSGAQCPLLEQR